MINLSKIEPDRGNIFNVPSPHSYQSVLWSYQPGHSVLFLKIGQPDQFDSDETFYLCFEDVEYFDGTTRWQGVNFKMATLDECRKLLERMEKYKSVSPSFLPGHLRLLTVETSGIPIKIVAGRATLTKDISSWNAQQ